MDSLCRPHAAVQVHEAPAVPACRRMPQFVEKTAAPPARGLGNPTSWLRVSSVEGSRAVNGRSRRAGRRSCGRFTAETQRAQRTQRWVGVGGREPLGSCRLAPAARHHEGTKNTKGLPERPSHASFRVGRDPQQNGEVGWPPHLPSLFLRGMRRRTVGDGSPLRPSCLCDEQPHDLRRSAVRRLHGGHRAAGSPQRRRERRGRRGVWGAGTACLVSLGSFGQAPRRHEGHEGTSGRGSHVSFVRRDREEKEVGGGVAPHLPYLFLRGMRRRAGGNGSPLRPSCLCDEQPHDLRRQDVRLRCPRATDCARYAVHP